jgi:hypothetical protein
LETSVYINPHGATSQKMAFFLENTRFWKKDLLTVSDRELHKAMPSLSLIVRNICMKEYEKSALDLAQHRPPLILR